MGAVSLPPLSWLNGQPTSNFHLWTPISSSGLYPQQHPTIHPTPFGRASHPDILSPVPLPMPAKPPAVASTSPSESSPETVIGDEKGNSRLDYFQAKAAQSLRFIARREETSKEKDEKELRAELKGKRVWRVGGVGVCAYSQDPELEETKKRIWKEGNGEEDWLIAAKSRTKMYAETKGVKPLIMWKLIEGEDVPRDALPLGEEADGAILYAARAYKNGGLHIGK